MLITLIGYRGCGKSTVAPALAARLGWDWVDADTVLEAKAGKSIREIFAESGEPEFRRLERETLVELLQRDRLVLAAGGGAVLNPETRADFRKAGPVVWLRADVATLEARIAADATTAARRPNLTSAGGTAEIAQLLAGREPLYRETATLVLDSSRSVDEIVDAIVSGTELVPLPG